MMEIAAQPKRSQRAPVISSDPYTYQMHAARCAEAARQRQVLVQHVLAKRGPIVYFAVIK